jgi:ABC-type sulfate transport system permease component
MFYFKTCAQTQKSDFSFSTPGNKLIMAAFITGAFLCLFFAALTIHLIFKSREDVFPKIKTAVISCREREESANTFPTLQFESIIEHDEKKLQYFSACLGMTLITIMLVFVSVVFCYSTCGCIAMQSQFIEKHLRNSRKLFIALGTIATMIFFVCSVWLVMLFIRQISGRRSSERIYMADMSKIENVLNTKGRKDIRETNTISHKSLGKILITGILCLLSLAATVFSLIIMCAAISSNGSWELWNNMYLISSSSS